MKNSIGIGLLSFFLMAAMLVISGCSVLESAMDMAPGFIPGVDKKDVDMAKSGLAVGQQLVEAVDTITPEQEYYIGRAAAATIINTYGVYEDDAATLYLNELGSTVAEFSDMPEVYSGYHFIILDSDEINAFATPGAFIFVTRGMLACCDGEEELAAVLAHEIAHIQNRHAIRSIKSSRWTKVFTKLGSEAAKQAAGGRDLAALGDMFEGVLDDVTKALIVNGYSRDLEEEADVQGVAIVERCGYSPAAMVAMLKVMEKSLGSNGGGFGKTHPSPEDRIETVEPMISANRITRNSARQSRFDAAMRGARNSRS